METDKDGKSVVGENENKPQSQVQLNSDEEAVKLLNAQNAVQNFLNRMNPEVLDLCLFDEQLVIVSPEGNSVGEFKARMWKPLFFKCFFFVLFIFILHSRESELHRYILDGKSALAWELPFPRCLGHLSST